MSGLDFQRFYIVLYCAQLQLVCVGSVFYRNIVLAKQNITEFVLEGRYEKNMVPIDIKNMVPIDINGVPIDIKKAVHILAYISATRRVGSEMII